MMAKKGQLRSNFQLQRLLFFPEKYFSRSFQSIALEYEIKGKIWIPQILQIQNCFYSTYILTLNSKQTL